MSILLGSFGLSLILISFSIPSTDGSSFHISALMRHAHQARHDRENKRSHTTTSVTNMANMTICGSRCSSAKPSKVAKVYSFDARELGLSSSDFNKKPSLPFPYCNTLAGASHSCLLSITLALDIAVVKATLTQNVCVH